MEKIIRDIAIGIDIGGTNIKLGLITPDGEILKKDSFLTSKIESEDDFYNRVCSKVKALSSSLRFQVNIMGIGIGVPGISQSEGTISHAANLPFLKESNIIISLQAIMHLPVYLIKDSSAAGLGEGLYGVAKGMKDYILITLGTGLGCAIFINGELLKGNTGLAGEFGHAIIKEGGRACGCGRNGCLETYVSGSGIVRTFIELLATTDITSHLRNIKLKNITSKLIYAAAQYGDGLALKSFELTGEILGKQLSNLLTLFDSEAIILAGGLANAGDLLLPSITHHIDENMLPFYKGKAQILFSALNTNEAALMKLLYWEQPLLFGKIKMK